MNGGRRTPLAWRNVTENKLRMAASVAGAAFAVVLMFMETGFKSALLESQVAILKRLECDLVLVNPARGLLAVPEAIPYRRLSQARSLAGVARVVPLYIDSDQSRWRSTTDGMPRRIRVLAARPEDDVFDIEEIRAQRDKLRRPNSALADWRSKEQFYGSFLELPTSELSHRRIQIVGTFSLGSDFQNNGNLVMSEENFLELFPRRAGDSEGAKVVDVGLVQLERDAPVEDVRRRLAESLPDDVVALTRPEFIDKERAFWESVTPIGIIFNIGVVMGFIVGVTICYQVLFSDIADRLAEFATLKAIGYSDRALFRVILEEAVILAVFGFVVGGIISAGLYALVGRMTGLPMDMTFEGVALLFLLTVSMCVASGCIAARKLFSADPAELFR